MLFYLTYSLSLGKEIFFGPIGKIPATLPPDVPVMSHPAILGYGQE
ncbi:MAG: hypothetical protein ACMUIA_06265 [bacterium]